MNIWDKIVNFFKGSAKIVPILVTAASIATAIIPNPTMETSLILKGVHDVLSIIAIQVGNNAQPAQ